MNYTFTTNDFEGPLDLLLHLVKTSKMDIYEINIKDLIDEYFNFINQMEELNIDVASEYLVMASELLHLKSRMLINKEIEKDDEEESELEINSEDDLRRKIIEYERIKNITTTFKDLEQKRLEIFEKSPESYQNYFEGNLYQKGEASIDDLYQAIISFQKKLKLSKPLNTKITRKELSITDKIKDIRNILDKKGKVNFLDLFQVPDRDYIVVTFLSVLDMSKNNEINIIQEGNFKPIMIEKRC